MTENEEWRAKTVWPSIMPEWPEKYTALWYRLNALKTMSKEHMESMLAYLAGANDSMWDMAYAHSGADPIIPVDGDPDYDEDYGTQLLRESRNER